jgi:short-subunit dehydrogenase
MTGTIQPDLNPTALVTGASVGIGYELAKCFAEDGYNLILVSRDKDRLTEVARELEQAHGIKVAILVRDLAEPRASDSIAQDLQKASVDIDVLVNNAGFALHGSFVDAPIEDILNMTQLHMTAVAHMSRLLLPGMIARGRGKILNVASTAAFQSGPFMAVYYATKAFVLSFSEAIATELEGTGVTVTALCPGSTRTEFQKRAGIELLRAVGGVLLMDAPTVARIGYKGLMKNKAVVIPGFKNRFLVSCVRFLPRAFTRKVVRFLNEKR